MAGSLLLLQGAHAALQVTGSGTLANAVAAAAATANLANQTDLDRFKNFVLNTGFSVAPTIGVAEIQLYLVPALDGTNFADVGTNLFNPNHYAGSFFPTKSQTAAQTLTLENVRVQPYLYKAYLLNLSAQTMAANWLLDAYGAAAKYT